MQSSNQRPGKLDTLSQHAVETNHRLGKPGMLSQHALQNMCCIKKDAEAQNLKQLTAKYLQNQKRPAQEEQAEEVATTSYFIFIQLR